MKYKVEITETLQKTITIEANSDIEAIRIVKDMYYNEEIILDSNDYIETKIEVI